MPLTVAMITRAIPPAMMAYSIAVAPNSAATKRSTQDDA